VAIARALATSPEIIYFDEPTSALDPELTGEVLDVMRQLAAEGMTMLVVTHEMGFARDVSSHVISMEDGRTVESAPSAALFAHRPQAGAHPRVPEPHRQPMTLRVYLKTPQRCSILPKSPICCVAFACIPWRSAALMRLASGAFWRISQHF